MATRPSSNREPSLLSADSLSRRSSLASNPDIFSDDYALAPIDSSLNLSLVDSVDTDDTLTNTNVTPYPAISNRLSVHYRPSSTAKRANGEESSSSLHHDGPPERSMSSSSRFSSTRAQSPYRGSTRPSHPYAMYPQITRASSIASSSTVRPQEQPFVHTGGPEHPYALYSQNTVEDDDEDIGTQPIPLGFSALGYGSSQGTSNPEVGDIVLSDGHIEQLPPYTRYADNVVAKGDMANINQTNVVEMDTTSSERSSLITGEPSHTNQPTLPEERLTVSEDEARKEGWREQARKRVCCGVALWLLAIIIAFVVFAGVLGGVIGGVVGRRQGATEAKHSGAAVTTVYMDAYPTNTNSSTPICPTGKYTIPFNQTQQIGSCVGTAGYDVSWGCLDIAYLGMTIGRTVDGKNTVQFDDYSVDTSQFLYGPQPPDFNGSIIELGPHKDTDNEDLGIAMFYYKRFDKLVILPGSALPPHGKRAISDADVLRRSTDWSPQPLQVGDMPWYCFWNNTISEFYIYLEKPADSSNTTSTSAPLPVATSPPPSTSSWSVIDQWAKEKGYSSAPTSYVGARAAVPEPTAAPDNPISKRSYTAPYYPEYPKVIKMVEKRQPEDNIQPYCQRMQVLADHRIVPREQTQILQINEIQFSYQPIDSGSRLRHRDTIKQLKSNCVCEWMST